MRWGTGPRKGAHSSGDIWAAMHQGAENSACRNTPPVSRATRKTSDRASIVASPLLIRRPGHVCRRADHRSKRPAAAKKPTSVPVWFGSKAHRSDERVGGKEGGST